MLLIIALICVVFSKNASQNASQKSSHTAALFYILFSTAFAAALPFDVSCLCHAPQEGAQRNPLDLSSALVSLSGLSGKKICILMVSVFSTIRISPISFSDVGCAFACCRVSIRLRKRRISAPLLVSS